MGGYGADDEDSASVAWVSLKLNPQNNVFDQYQSIYLCNNESFSLDFLDLEIVLSKYINFPKIRQLDGKSREWLVKAAQGDYHELAKLAAEEPRLTGLKLRAEWLSADNDKGVVVRSWALLIPSEI
uniref:Uncharacterized protein n=1 Tax=Vespula pensylvanica TaxID=30213 RepID=A0A834K2Y7_VESPE|nr:hypothetical protein H0235_016254 [Vespula pensylvanica]